LGIPLRVFDETVFANVSLNAFGYFAKQAGCSLNLLFCDMACFCETCFRKQPNISRNSENKTCLVEESEGWRGHIGP
jgi:hypothetical protein